MRTGDKWMVVLQTDHERQPLSSWRAIGLVKQWLSGVVGGRWL